MFLYFRTPRNILYSNRALTAFLRGLPEPMQMGLDGEDPTSRTTSLFVFGKEHVTWEDGFVARFWSHETPSDIAKQMSDTLSEFEAWAIHDCQHDFVENPPGGQLSRFFGKIAEPNSAKSIALSQIFILGQEYDRKFDNTVDQIRASMKPGQLCLPVFHFRDGRIIFLNSEEPGNITAHRCKNHLKRLKRWGIVDSGGRAFSAAGEDDLVWQDIPPEIIGRYDFGFGGPEDIEFDEDEPDEG
jgi:hypothetical protein